MKKLRKRSLGYARSYYFMGENYDAATPLRAAAQFVKRHVDELVVLAVGVNYGVNYSDGCVAVTLTVEWDSEKDEAQ